MCYIVVVVAMLSYFINVNDVKLMTIKGVMKYVKLFGIKFVNCPNVPLVITTVANVTVSFSLIPPLVHF